MYIHVQSCTKHKSLLVTCGKNLLKMESSEEEKITELLWIHYSH